MGELWPKENWSAYHQNCCHIYVWCDSNFDGRHSNSFWAIIHPFLHPSLKQISPRIIQGSITTHTERSIKNPWVTHRYALWVFGLAYAGSGFEILRARPR